MADQQQFFLKWNDFQSNMVSSFRHLRDEKSFTDVTLACEGQTCKAHKMVLSACSPYFKSLLEVGNDQTCYFLQITQSTSAYAHKIAKKSPKFSSCGTFFKIFVICIKQINLLLLYALLLENSG